MLTLDYCVCLLIVCLTTTSSASASHMVQFYLSNRHIQDFNYDENTTVWLHNFIDSCETIFIIPGWKNTAHDDIFIEMSDAFEHMPRCYNTVRVNWPDAMQNNYAFAMLATRKVAEETATFIRKLQKINLLKRTQIVGFSLGAHMAGMVSRILIHYLGQDIVSEIIALDPAGPGFTDLFTPYANAKLRPEDAQRVIVLMTNAGCTGTSQRLGHVNFIANNGRDQTGCAPSDCTCSHHKALDYFIESLASDHFVGYSTDFEGNAVFGVGRNSHTRPGDYYFDTNLLPPYARG